MKLFIGASSSDNTSNEIFTDCSQLLEDILKENDLVFGAYDKGLMGISYRIAKKNKRNVTGICPEVYKKSFENLECDIEVLTTSIIDSTRKIYDACIRNGGRPNFVFKDQDDEIPTGENKTA